MIITIDRTSANEFTLHFLSKNQISLTPMLCTLSRDEFILTVENQLVDDSVNHKFLSCLCNVALPHHSPAKT